MTSARCRHAACGHIAAAAAQQAMDVGGGCSNTRACSTFLQHHMQEGSASDWQGKCQQWQHVCSSQHAGTTPSSSASAAAAAAAAAAVEYPRAHLHWVPCRYYGVEQSAHAVPNAKQRQCCRLWAKCLQRPLKLVVDLVRCTKLIKRGCKGGGDNLRCFRQQALAKQAAGRGMSTCNDCAMCSCSSPYTCCRTTLKDFPSAIRQLSVLQHMLLWGCSTA